MNQRKQTRKELEQRIANLEYHAMMQGKLVDELMVVVSAIIKLHKWDDNMKAVIQSHYKEKQMADKEIGIVE